jgi:hypothetical protein
LWFSQWIKIWIYGFYDSKVHTLIRCFKFLIVWTKQKVMLLYFNLLNSISQFKFNKLFIFNNLKLKKLYLYWFFNKNY